MPECVLYTASTSGPQAPLCRFLKSGNLTRPSSRLETRTPANTNRRRVIRSAPIGMPPNQ
ncbi:hypothetical protein PISMIDRAFT_675338 [Pisolithus microcarpus 441]|uniref:Uncharacterized protein n=1 Tax=Pisolithus microcarpus 441 TaxID=765257 RepID=A0A0C9ZXX3_9AGAM|nr:hypothetical protein PISMIDRAFT_675338 [Pisolithus microcarpus 441]